MQVRRVVEIERPCAAVVERRRRRASRGAGACSSRSRMSRPSLADDACSSWRSHWRILWRARPVRTCASQSRLGSRVGDVMISTVSEFSSCARQRRDAAVHLRALRSAGRPPCAPRTRSRSASRPSGSWMTSPVGREDEDLVLVQVELQELEELVRASSRRAAARGSAGTRRGACPARRRSSRPPCTASAPRCRTPPCGASRACGSGSRTAGARARTPSCAATGSRSTSAARCSP